MKLTRIFAMPVILAAFFAAGCAQAVSTPAVAPSGAAAVKLPGNTPPAASAAFVVRLWSWKASTEDGRQILGQLTSGKKGTQSRDLSNLILMAAFDGKIKPVKTGCHTFEFEFHDIMFRKPEFVWVSTNTSETQAEVLGKGGRASVMAAVCDGAGSLLTEVGPGWATGKMALTVHSPFLPPKIRYPLSGALKTCGPATAGTCGGAVSNPTTLYNIVSRRGVSHFHFVVE